MLSENSAARLYDARTPFSGRVVELDAIRGIAILLVVVYHYFATHAEPTADSPWASLHAIVDFGWIGVDIFFVLSGFLIGGILLRNRDAENYFQTFYIRRAARLLPIYLLLVAGYLFTGPFLFRIGGAGAHWLMVGDSGYPIWSYLLYVQNFFAAITQSWGGHWLAPTWSLAVEEQFYLLAPLALYVIPRKHLSRTLLPLVVFSMLFRAAVQYQTGQWIPAFVLLPDRWDSLIIGILMADALSAAQVRDWLAARAGMLIAVFTLLLCGLVVMIAVPLTRDSLFMAAVGYTYIGLFSASLILVALHVRTRWTAAIFRNALLIRLGVISYGVYLLHQMVVGLVFFFSTGQEPLLRDLSDGVRMVVAMVITIGIAELSWRWLEKPLVDLAHRTSYRRSHANVNYQGAAL